MNLTDYHAKYFAHELTKRCASDSPEKLAGAVDNRLIFGDNLLTLKALEQEFAGKVKCIYIDPPCNTGSAFEHLIFLSLPSPEVAIARVAERLRQGGHSVPDEVVRRRFVSGRSNFQRMYRALVDAWALFDNTGTDPVLLDWGDKE